MKRLRLLHHKINRRVYGSRYWSRPADGLSSVIAVEEQRRGVIHFHTLDAGMVLPPRRQVDLGERPRWWAVNGDGAREFRRMTAMDWWYALGGGFARVYEFRRAGGAEAYVSKYVCKGGAIFLAGPFGSTSPQLRFASVR